MPGQAVMFKNLLPFPLRIMRDMEAGDSSFIIFPSFSKNDAGNIASVSTEYADSVWIGNVPVYVIVEEATLPPQQDNIIYIVPKEVATSKAVDGRSDIVYPENLLSEQTEDLSKMRTYQFLCQIRHQS